MVYLLFLLLTLYALIIFILLAKCLFESFAVFWTTTQMFLCSIYMLYSVCVMIMMMVDVMVISYALQKSFRSSDNGL